MLKRWCSIKEIEVYLLCEILTLKDTPQGQKKLLRASLTQNNLSPSLSEASEAPFCIIVCDDTI